MSQNECEVVKATLIKIEKNENAITERKHIIFDHEREVEKLERENLIHKELVYKLRSQGFCAVDTPKELRDSITGKVVEKWNDHKDNCRNKKKKKEKKYGMVK